MTSTIQLLDLNFLSPEERQTILSVLERDSAIQTKEQQRVGLLKKEMREMRMRGLIRGTSAGGGAAAAAPADASRSCARCRQKFGWLFNKARICVQCSHRVCTKCCQPLPNNRWLCSFCIKQMELEAMTGQWFLALCVRNKRVRRTDVCSSELIRASIRHARPAAPSPVANGTSVGSTFGDVKRAISRTLDTSSDLSAGGLTGLGVGGADNDIMSPGDYYMSGRPAAAAAAAGGGYPRDDDRRLLRDLLVRPSGGGNAAPPSSSDLAQRQQQQQKVEVRRVRRQQSSDSVSTPGAEVPVSAFTASYGQGQRPNDTGQKIGAAAQTKSTVEIGQRRKSRGDQGPEAQEGRRSGDDKGQGQDRRAAASGAGYGRAASMSLERDNSICSENPSMASSDGAVNVVTQGDDVDDDFYRYGCPEVGAGVAAGRIEAASTLPTRSRPPPLDLHHVHQQCQSTRLPAAQNSSSSPLRPPRNLTIADRQPSTSSSSPSSAPRYSSSSPCTAAFPPDDEDDDVSTQHQLTSPSHRLPTSTAAASAAAGSSSSMTSRAAVNHAEHNIQQPNHRRQNVDAGSSGSVDSRRRSDQRPSSTVLTPDSARRSSRLIDAASTGYRTVSSSDVTDAAASGGVNDAVSQQSNDDTASLPSVAVNAMHHGNGPYSASDRASMDAVSDDVDETEDIGEMFATYGAGGPRKANSHTNLNRLSPFSSSKESIVSVYSNAGEENYGKYPVTGEIQFALVFNYKQSSLEVDIKQCRGIAAVDPKRNCSDPYVKTYLLPDKTKNGKRKTRSKKHTLSPVFNEVIKYHVTKSELESRTLCLMVWNNDRFGRNDFLGEVNVAFDHHTFDDPAPKWYKLQDRNLSPLSMLTYKGDINLCLKYASAEHLNAKRQAVSGGITSSSASSTTTTGGELLVLVKQARNLTAVRSNGFSDPFCKCFLLPDRTRGGTQKSPVVKRNCNPSWNFTFVFENVTWSDLKERGVELTIWDHDRLVSNDFLGGVRLNLGTGKSESEPVDWMDSKGEEISLWQAMLDRPNCWIEGTLLLRPHMSTRK